ncbi:DUF3618 domain-containing protein [Labedella phragmitis]|uniref:DUF3618 domain-containing protein n=1 Tax=Labedella phragmitis TaxID=2498849 RepID=A0A3S3ZAV2_9MICO|nr:DUF3618 domain-containing protein [Labedella phragmitis]RWZ52696.1 DUF3618 domain-containing protein [Labedella phragmitis]
MTGTDNPSAEEVRAELVATLNAIEDKLNVPKQVGKATDRAKAKIAELREENPQALVGGVAAVALAVGAGVWAVARAVLKR